MLDFLNISTKINRNGTIEVYPKFIMKKSSDLMIRGRDFYAIWDSRKGLWSTDEDDAIQLIDIEIDEYVEKNLKDTQQHVYVKHMWDAESGIIDIWHKYCQKQLRDSYSSLDENIIFSNAPVNKKDFASKRLQYSLDESSYEAYDELISVLYSPEERHKIEWAIGSIVSGDSKTIQKFIVLYGAAGTGKSTILNIIQMLFDGYYCVFDAKALGSANAVFALEAFKSNPLVAIQHDGDLSHIEDNTRLNSLVSHELMTVNEKFKSTYTNRFNCFLFMGTNKPVKITDAKSGLIRRLIDVSPTGNKVPAAKYKKLMKKIPFELGGIAKHCLDIYLEDPSYYDDYVAVSMLGASNDFYNFMLDSYLIFKKDNGVSQKTAWEMYKHYCDDAKVQYPFPLRIFKEELKNYFDSYSDRMRIDNGERIRNYYSGFKKDKFNVEDLDDAEKKEIDIHENWIQLENQESIFDNICRDYPAQYANQKDIPFEKWDFVSTTLKDIDTSKTHFVKFPEEYQNHIVIDFDIPDANGNKCLEKNLEAAENWPKTYAEVSKSGQGLHLHYIYQGDVSKLSKIYDEHIEIKVFTGKSSLRRKKTLCNNIDISTISSNLPLKGEEKMVDFNTIKSERSLRVLIMRNLNKEIHPGTKPSIDFIYKILEDAYASDLHYDISDMKNSIITFAAGSTNHADYCLKLVKKMHFKSDEISDTVDFKDDRLVFYDVEVFPNLFIVNWKYDGEENKIVRMINPSPDEISNLVTKKLVGFNCRRYDNHILYGRIMGYSELELFNLSQKIINGSPNCFFGEAYNISYTDIYDFSSEKKSLKKFELELDIHHQELGLPWDQPVPKEMWNKVAEYCDNDVLATEALFHSKDRKADFIARQILADVAGGSVNDTTNMLTTKIIFGNNRKPQSEFNYRFMGEESEEEDNFVITEDMTFYSFDDPFTKFDKKGRPIFPGYQYRAGVSTYRGEEVGEGGYVYAEPGMYGNVALLDISSMHPSSIIAEQLFGPTYTKRFQEIKDARVAIKHKDFEKAKTMLNGALAKYLTDESLAKSLAYALKIAINSVYGLTSAKFDNAFHDIRNVDNIVAKRGALFMINLKHMVQERGYTVAHIKTDSIKIPDATPEIIQFVMDYGKMYGYSFEHEATYDRMCLVNDAVYIAKYKDGDWTATGTQFQVPYVFKTLFSKEPLTFKDFCETKEVKSALYLDLNEDLPNVTEYEQIKEWRNDISDGKVISLKNHKILDSYSDINDEDLKKEIAKGHNFRFVGKVGNFVPVKKGGGLLLREQIDKKTGIAKYYAASNSSGYRWLESEVVKNLKQEDNIDKRYFESLANDAIDSIKKYGDYEWFVSDEPYISPIREVPFDGPYILN